MSFLSVFARFTLWVIFVIVIRGSMYAQTVIEGVVLDAEGKTVDAYVTAKQKGSSSILVFTDTDSKGCYRLEFIINADSVTITASGLSIGNQVKVVSNHSQRVDFCVKNTQVQLKEISIRAKNIIQQGDTLSYLVEAYKQQSDRVIGDVLKRMPGIEVTNNGRIKFNGKSISKFYVEDMDLLQGRYGLATNNINAQDVATVEVLENHQPIKVLQGRTNTDDIAINLKLKDSAKGTVSINAMLGSGAQQVQNIGKNPLWMGEIVGMYFAKQRQDITLYKTNNIGDDISKELTLHYSGINNIALNPFCPMGVVMPNGSGLPYKRTFDNHSHILTMNHVVKIFKDTEVGLNIAYHNDRIHREGISESDQFINNDSRLYTQETMISDTKVNNLNAQSRYYWNAPNGFLANVLKFDTNWNNDYVDGTLLSGNTGFIPVNYDNNHILQSFNYPQLSISNAFSTIRNFGKHTLDLHFSAGYSQRPNTLSVCIDSLSQGISSQFRQDVTSRHIVGNFHTYYDFRYKAFTLNYGFVAHASMHGIETNLNGFGTGIYSSCNDLWYNTYELVLGQNYKFEQRGWRVSLGCPLNLYTQTLDDYIRHDNHNYTHLLVTPSFSTTYEWREWSGNINASYSKTIGDPGGIYSGYIMNNYRSFQRSYVEHLSETDRISLTSSISYRSAINATFFRINGSYNHTCDNQIYGTTYQGATSVVQAVDQRTESNIYNIGFNGSKGFDWLQATLSAFVGYSYSTNNRLIDSTIYPFHSQSVSVGVGGAITPLPWINFVLSSGYSWSISQTYTSQNNLARSVQSAMQRLKINVYVTNKLTLTALAEDNYNNMTADNRHFWFGDISAKYKLKHVDLELQLNNLFNQLCYTRVNYNGLNIYAQTSQLRPRNAVLCVRFKLL